MSVLQEAKEAAAATKKEAAAAAAKEAAVATKKEAAQLQDLCTFISAAGTDTSLQLAAELWQYQQQASQEKAARTPDVSKRVKLLSTTANKRKRYAENEEIRSLLLADNLSWAKQNGWATRKQRADQK